MRWRTIWEHTGEIIDFDAEDGEDLAHKLNRLIDERPGRLVLEQVHDGAEDWD